MVACYISDLTRNKTIMNQNIIKVLKVLCYEHSYYGLMYEGYVMGR